MNQHEWVYKCQTFYEENRLEPGNPEDGLWHKAHYPEPACLGGETFIWLLKEHHAVQGVLQSLEYNHCCLGGWEKHYLTGEWAYLLPDCLRLFSERGKSNCEKLHSVRDEFGRSLNGLGAAKRLNAKRDREGRSINAVKGGQLSKDLRVGVHGRSAEEMTENGKVGGRLSKEKGLGIFAPGQQQAGGLAASKQRWQCTETGKVSAAGPLTGYQKARGIDPTKRVRRLDLEGG
jgi:hypothetical protein